MKISYSWLNEYVPLSLTPEELAASLTMAGLEVEEVVALGAPLDGVVVGEVKAVRVHPDADRLTVCDVDLGGDAPVQVVCGAPNVAAGQKVPVATVGTTLQVPDRNRPGATTPVKVKKAKMRGEVSEGMICAEDELGLSDDHAGIMVLDPGAPVGQAFEAYLKEHGRSTRDDVLDVAITPNRPDAVSHFGVARDAAALTGTHWSRPDVALPEAGGAVEREVAVEIEAPEGCHRYVALLVRGVRVGPSPRWMQQRLEAVGLRPRNTIVDITNYVMYECGQPLHAFDFDRIAGARIVVRATPAEEPFTTLDGKTHTLPAGTLMICDAERRVAIAGVMGGENSEVSEATTNVLIESAYFDPSTIRRAARALGVQTDASYRFERGVDPEGQLWAAARAAALMVELAGGTLVEGRVDAHPRPHRPRVIRVRPSRISDVLGVRIEAEDAVRLLGSIGFDVSVEDPLEEFAERALAGRGLEVQASELTLMCRVPSFRPDVEREVDVIEEVARLYGYDNIPEPAQMAIPNRSPRAMPEQLLRRDVRSLLCGLGFREVYANSLLRREVAERFNHPLLTGGAASDEVVETLKPISQEMAALRPSLLPGVLDIMSHNQHHGQAVLRLMEFGHVFRQTDRTDTIVSGYAEHAALLLALSGPATGPRWDTTVRTADFYDLKGIVEHLFASIGLDGIDCAPVHTPTPLTAYHLEVRRGTERLGLVARLSDALTEAYDLRDPVYVAEFNWGTLAAQAVSRRDVAYRPVDRFPAVERDLAVVTKQAQPVGQLVATIRSAGGLFLRQVTVFDLYEGERIGAGRKSVAFGLRFAADRTLKDKEVDRAIEAIVSALQEGHGAELRS